MQSITEKDLDRFWGKVDKEKSNIFYNGTRCWEWIAACDRYGQIKIGGKHETSHRVSWELTYGPIPEGLFVCHHCDNTLCCNPDHLFLGTHHDNMDDRNKKGRQASGERNGSRLHPEKLARGDRSGSHLHPESYTGENNGGAKLTRYQVVEIRRRYRWGGIGGDSSYTLAKEYGVSPPLIQSIVKNKLWK
jgi:hypothetical protein